MPPLFGLLPAIIGAGASIGGGLLAGGGGDGSDALEERATTQNQALEELLRQIGLMQGRAANLRMAEQFNLDQLGNLFNFSGLPGLSPEASAFLAERAAPFEGLRSVAPQQDEFARLASLLGPLTAAGTGTAAGQLANIDRLQQSELASALGGAASGFSQTLALQNLLDQINAQSTRSNIPALLAAMNNAQTAGLNPFGTNPTPIAPAF